MYVISGRIPEVYSEQQAAFNKVNLRSRSTYPSHQGDSELKDLSAIKVVSLYTVSS